MKLRGYFVDIMFQVNPEYKQHVKYENGKEVLYMLVLGLFIFAFSLHCFSIK